MATAYAHLIRLIFHLQEREKRQAGEWILNFNAVSSFLQVKAIHDEGTIPLPECFVGSDKTRGP